MPGLKTETFGGGDYTWLLNTHGLNDGSQCVLDISAFTKATHYPDGYVRSGTPINVANPKAAVPWADTAGAVLAFVEGDVATDGVEDPNTAIVTHADGVIVANLPVAFVAPTTVKTERFGRFI